MCRILGFLKELKILLNMFVKMLKILIVEMFVYSERYWKTF